MFRFFQLQKMESDILPLQQANSELSEKSGMLQAEKKILEDEIRQWKARTQVGEEKSSPEPELELSRSAPAASVWSERSSIHRHNFSFRPSIW